VNGSKKSAILAGLLIAGGALAIVPIAQSKQIVSRGTSSRSVTTLVADLSTPPAIDSSNDVDHYYNLIGRPFANAVLEPHLAYIFADFFRTPASRSTSFYGVQLEDLNSEGATSSKSAVTFARNCVADNSLTHAHGRTVPVEDKINSMGIILYIDHYSIFRSARNK
jgi:hypothetical protein